MKINNFSKCFIAIVLVEGVGILSGFLTSASVTTWYIGLEKPALNPPSWIFGPVWTMLYLLMAIAAFLIWKKGLQNKEVKVALILFIFQLVLNFFWSIIFFYLHNPAWAFVEIVVLWLTIIATIFVFFKVNRLAAYLLLPYILWVSFAAYLNYGIWMLN
jgi:tryptophan-rich sensory protein